jgi:hypothetical protein
MFLLSFFTGNDNGVPYLYFFHILTKDIYSVQDLRPQENKEITKGYSTTKEFSP